MTGKTIAKNLERATKTLSEQLKAIRDSRKAAPPAPVKK